MYQLDWSSLKKWQKEEALRPTRSSSLPVDRVDRTMLVHWMEHCIECAPPTCYESCPLFVARADKKCSRFTYGIYPNPAFNGLLSFGADIRFRRWAKLQTAIYPRELSVAQHRVLSALDRTTLACVNPVAKSLEPINPKRRLNGALTVVRGKMFNALSKSNTLPKYDHFVVECFSPNKETFRLIVECNRTARPFREALEIVPGWNFHTLPASSFHLHLTSKDSLLTIYPENDYEARLIFTWLDFVRYQPTRDTTDPSVQPTAPRSPAEKVKCVAWDLDNTLWDGTLAEDTANAIQLRPHVVDVIRQLDQRGILQTIVSKNHFDDAWPVIRSYGLDKFFLYPQIHWGPKSESLKAVAKHLNIDTNTFALIDDSSFERAEVQNALTEVRVYGDDHADQLLGYTEFDAPITIASKARRASYQQEIARQQQFDSMSGDYKTFLCSCELRLDIFRPKAEEQIVRCLELVQRTNQLNLSARRLSRQQLDLLLSDPKILSLAMRCEDRFGNYGTVGFAIIDEKQNDPTLTDFCLSCRVAQKQVEHAFILWLARHEHAQGKRRLRAHLVRTKRNTPLLKVFSDLPFQQVEHFDNVEVLELSLEDQLPTNDIITVSAELENSSKGDT